MKNPANHPAVAGLIVRLAVISLGELLAGRRGGAADGDGGPEQSVTPSHRHNHF